MKTLLVLLLLVALDSADARPLNEAAIAGMVSQSEAVMGAGVCQIANDTTVYTNETIVVALPAPVGSRRILVKDYNWFRAAGYKRNASGLYEMSARVKSACRSNEVGGRCLGARAYFPQVPVEVRPPGNGVKVLSP